MLPTHTRLARLVVLHCARRAHLHIQLRQLLERLGIRRRRRLALGTPGLHQRRRLGLLRKTARALQVQNSRQWGNDEEREQRHDRHHND